MEIKLSNNNTMPLVGLGTWRLTDPHKLDNIINTALELGYRLIDTSPVYENEESLGVILEKIFKVGKVKREYLYITSKLWNLYHNRVNEGIQKTLKDLRLDYLDLYLIHWPVTFKYDKKGNTLRDQNGKPVIDTFNLQQIWREMEECVKKGYVKSIGVANFGIENLSKLLSFCKIKPVINQIEIHPYLQQKELISYCRDNNINITSYSSLGSQFDNNDKLRLKDNNVLIRIAKDNNCSIAKVILSWLTNQNISIIPKSSSYEHLKENIELIKLSAKDYEEINNIDTVYRYVEAKDFGPDRFK